MDKNAIIAMLAALAASLEASKDVSKGQYPEGAVELIEQGRALAAELEAFVEPEPAEPLPHTLESVQDFLDNAGVEIQAAVVGRYADERPEFVEAELAEREPQEPVLWAIGSNTFVYKADAERYLRKTGQSGEPRPLGYLD